MSQSTASSRPCVRRSSFLRFGVLVLFLGGTFASCSTVPITGRSQFNVVPIAQDKALGAQAYGQTLGEARLITSGPQYEQVRRVVDRLIAVADDPGFDWEVSLVDDPQTVNAWAMPGGKMAVYTGILPVTQDDTGLAVVMGHEIGHAVARHGTERISREMPISLALQIFGGENAELLQQATGLLVSLPWGRKQELESDHIGLIYMARAGYDPRKAPDFWRRMAALSQGAPPEFLSTHPANETRIAQIEEYMPDAMEAYQAALAAGGR